MDLSLLIAFASVLTVILVSVGYFYNRTNKAKPAAEPRPRAPPNRAQNVAVPRRAQMARNQRARLRANAQVQEQESEDDEREEIAEENTAMFDEKIGTKKRAKLEAKAERKQQREAEEKMRQDKKKRQEQQEEERKKEEEKLQAEEKRLEEEEKKAREEKARQEYEAYLKMKEAFSVEEEGYEEGETDEQNVLQEFVTYIKKNKVVVVEDLAALFKLKTQACIDRIQDLQKDEILSGVMDDRGKFIYISQQELEAVAKFIRQRGRVSITELAENSNSLINLTPVA